MVSQRGQDSARTCHLQRSAEYQLVFIEPQEEYQTSQPVSRGPLHSTPAGSPPTSPEREEVGVSPIPVVESEESYELDDLSSESPEEIIDHCQDKSVPAVMAGQDPLTELVALLNDEDRANARDSLNQIVTDLENFIDKMDNYTVEDIRTPHDSDECLNVISGVRRDLEAMQVRMNYAATLMPKLDGEDVSGGEKLIRIKQATRTKARDYMNLLREKLGQLKNLAAGAGAGGGPAGGGPAGGGAGAAHFQIFQDPPARNNDILAKTRARSNAVIDDGRVLMTDMQEIDIYMWDAAQDSDVAKAMRKLKTWKEDLAKIVKVWREVDELLIVSNIAERNRPAEATEAKELVDDLQKIFKDTKKEVESEDLRRGLHSLDVSSSAKVNYPTFEGNDDEDWEDFKVKLEKALADNRVRTSDKCDKLRSCLSGHAIKLVPSSQTDFTAAMAALEKSFGDSTRLLQFKVKSLHTLGKIPRSDDWKGGKSAVEWYLNLETILESLIDLGSRTDDEDIKTNVYSKTIITTVACLFPELYGSQILDCEGRGKTRLRNVVTLVVKFRCEAQQWLLALRGRP